MGNGEIGDYLLHLRHYTMPMLFKRTLLRFVLCFILLIVCQRSWAFENYSLSFYHDPNHQTITQPLAALTFTPIIKINPLENKGVYIFRLKLNAPLASSGYLLYLYNEHLDSVYLYLPKESGLELKEIGGNSFHKKSREGGFIKFNLDGKHDEYYLMVHFKKDAAFPINLVPLSAYAETENWKFLGVGLYYGFVLLVILVNFAMYFGFKDKIFLYYCFLQLSICLSIFNADGLLNTLTRNLFILYHADLPFHVCILWSVFLFSGRLLGIKDKYVYRKSIVLGFTIFIGLAYAVDVIWDEFYAYLIGEIAVFSLLLCFWIVGIMKFRQSIFARFFVIGFSFFLAFAFDYYVFRKIGFFGLDLTEGQLKIGSLIDMFVLSIASGYKIRKLSKENQYYRTEIEKKVHENLSEEETALQKETAIHNVKEKYKLTDREYEVLLGIKDGLTNVEIANKLFVSHNTIKYHTKNLFNKLEITSRAQAVSRFHE